MALDSASDLAQTLRRAADAHGQHEEQTGRPDADWPNRYGLYLELEQAGLEHLLIPARLEGATVPAAIVTSRTEAEVIVGSLGTPPGSQSRNSFRRGRAGFSVPERACRCPDQGTGQGFHRRGGAGRSAIVVVTAMADATGKRNQRS
jgi:hypothetical protein